jgi:hypothetical protein
LPSRRSRAGAKPEWLAEVRQERRAASIGALGLAVWIPRKPVAVLAPECTRFSL